MKFSTIDQITIVLAIITLILFSDLALNSVFGQSRALDYIQESKAIMAKTHTIYEDQLIVCNFWNVCQEINADDYMSKKNLDKLWNNFDQELDTFNLSDAINGESKNWINAIIAVVCT